MFLLTSVQTHTDLQSVASKATIQLCVFICSCVDIPLKSLFWHRFILCEISTLDDCPWLLPRDLITLSQRVICRFLTRSNGADCTGRHIIESDREYYRSKTKQTEGQGWAITNSSVASAPLTMPWMYHSWYSEPGSGQGNRFLLVNLGQINDQWVRLTRQTLSTKQSLCPLRSLW